PRERGVPTTPANLDLYRRRQNAARGGRGLPYPYPRSMLLRCSAGERWRGPVRGRQRKEAGGARRSAMNTSTWNRRTVVATVCLGALLSAGVIGSATAQTPVSGGHFCRALSSDPASLDPQLTNTSRAIAVKMTIFDSFIRQNPKTLAIEPGAAESWSVSSDGKILTFRLPRGLRFIQ